MLKKIINNTAAKIIFGALVLWASFYIDSGSGVRWLLDTACRPDSVCVPVLALGIGAVLLVLLVYLMRSIWRQLRGAKQ